MSAKIQSYGHSPASCGLRIVVEISRNFRISCYGKGEILKNMTIPYAIASLLYLVLGCPLSGCAEPITPDQIQSHFKSIKP